MADNKQYITQTQDHGAVMISEEVIAAIVIHALKDVDGVTGMSSKLSIDMVSPKNWNKGLKVVLSEGNDIKVDCNIIVAYGQSVISVAQAAQEAITAAVDSMTGVKPSVVNINVCGISR